MSTQLRTYRIRPGGLYAFAAEWREKIVPLRQRLGFEILGAWTDDTSGEFVWVLRHPGPEPWDELDRSYHESDERRAMEPNPARWIESVEERFVDDVWPPNRSIR